MSYPTYVGAGTLNVQTSGSIVYAYYPSGSVGDIAIAAVYNSYSGNFSTPVGWTMIRDVNGWAVAWRRLTSTSQGGVFFSAAISQGFLMGVGYRFSGCDGGNSPTSGTRNNSGSGWSVLTGGAVSSPKDTSLMVWVAAVDDNVAADDAATYFSERNEQQTALGAQGMMALYTYEQAEVGSVPADSYGISAISNYVCSTFALKPYSYVHGVYGITSSLTDEILGIDNRDIDTVVGV